MSGAANATDGPDRELEDLYKEIILDHNRNPANFRAMTDADRQVEADNPLCGDRLTLFLKIDGERIADVSFLGQGCAISMASASMLTRRLKGASLAEAERLFARVHAVMTGESEPAAGGPSRSQATETTAQGPEPDLGELEALAGVRRYPMRVKCATLSWHTLRAALDGDRKGLVTTE